MINQVITPQLLSTGGATPELVFLRNSSKWLHGGLNIFQPLITNGAGRVAEVGARFTLDAMPGKQMAIDADLTAGLIDEKEARERRKRIGKEADFYGAMDGASKFVKGDAIASIIIVAINLFGGFAIGLGSQGLSMSDAVDTYARLSVGDGRVSQVPARLSSLTGPRRRVGV